MPKYKLLKIMKMFLDCNDSRTAVHACLEINKPLQFIYLYTEWVAVLKRSQTNIGILGDICICFTAVVLRFLCVFAPFSHVTSHSILKSLKSHFSPDLFCLSCLWIHITCNPPFFFINRFTSSSIFFTFCHLEIKINFAQTCAGGSTTEPKRARDFYHLIFCWHH